jgi:hypothetical protein
MFTQARRPFSNWVSAPGRIPIIRPSVSPSRTAFRAVPLETQSAGRATVEALALNRTLIHEIREEEVQIGRHPPTKSSGG